MHRIVHIGLLALTGCGGVQIDTTTPPDPEYVGAVVEAVEALGENRIDLIDDPDKRAYANLLCLSAARRIVVRDVPQLWAFCEPVLKALD